MKEDEAHRLKALQQENARLKRIVADQALDSLNAQGPAKGKMVSPCKRRAAVAYLVRRPGLCSTLQIGSTPNSPLCSSM